MRSFFYNWQTSTCPSQLVEVVRQYLAKPYTNGSGIGLTAGGSISPLLGALYLHPLDTAFARLSGEGKVGENNDEMVLMRREWTYGNASAKAEKQGIFYRRFMDDIIILAKTRWMLRKAIKLMYNILHDLGQRVHRKKKIFIGRTERGFDLFGYHFTPRNFFPSTESFCRMLTRASRLYKRGASEARLWRYVSHWQTSVLGGVFGRVALGSGELNPGIIGSGTNGRFIPALRGYCPLLLGLATQCWFGTSGKGVFEGVN